MRKIRVLLIQPNFNFFYIPFLPNHDPLVLIMLGTIIQDIAEVKIFDRRYETERNLIKTLKEFKPDIVGTRTHTSGELFTVKRILETAKKVYPQATTIIGGQHPTLLPDDLNMPCVDLICIGAGEETFRQVIEAKEIGTGFDHIKGLAIRKGNQLYFTEPRQAKSGEFSWPPLNRSLSAKYSKHFPSGITLTSIGCPHRCNFCALWVTTQGTYRLRKAEDIVEDIASIKQCLIYISDDNTFNDYEHAMQVYDGLTKRGIKKKYGAYARVDTITKYPDLFEKWRGIGLEALVVGFEVIDDKGLQDLNKKTTLEMNLKAIEILNNLGIQNFAHFILFPEFTVQDFHNLWNFIEKNKITQPFFIPLTPTAGTPLFKEAKEKKLLSSLNYGFYTLEYMVYKTALPKWRFYYEYMKIWLSSISPFFYIRMRKNFPFIWYLFRIRLLLPAICHILIKGAMQLIEEKKIDPWDIKNQPFPSQRIDYRYRFLESLKEKSG